MTSKSCCDKAINEGMLIRKGRACWVCPTCGKDQMLKLVFMHNAGIEYVPGKGLKTTKRKGNENSKTIYNTANKYQRRRSPDVDTESR